MCGISLIINAANQPVNSAQLKCMNDKVMHRGPDGEGYYIGSNFGMGHRRLSVIDLSEAGLQPMQREDDCIIFNGMIYNYAELKEELIGYGYTFKTQTDTEVLLVACMHWGIKAFDKLNGMWAFAWYKAATGEMILCRDRYGIKPIYYTSLGGIFAAASEIKQFTCLPGFTSRLNYSTTLNFLLKGWLNYSAETFFENVYELGPGHYLVYNLASHQFTIKQWYNLREASVPKKVKKEDAISKTRELFRESVRLRMRSDVKLGSCLSGGIDSSAIVSAVHAGKMAPDEFVTITSCYTDKKFDEQEYSDVVTSQTGFKALKVFPDLDDLIDNGDFDKMLYYQDQPFGTASHYSEFHVFKTAHEHGLTVMLDGQGSDEYLCGYDDFFTIFLRQLLHSGKIGAFIRNARAMAKHEGKTLPGFIKNYCRSAYWFPLVSRAKSMAGRANTWLNPLWRRVAERELVAFDRKDIREFSYGQMLYSSLPLQLHSEDRNSMMFSIESRLPFLDHRLVEFVMSLPHELKIKDGFSKYVLREAVDEMPDRIKKRTNKMGFVAPDEPWVRQNHQRLRRELVDAIHNTGIFSANLLHRFDKFIQGRLGYEPIYFRAIALNRFIRVFNMQPQYGVQATNNSLPKEVYKSATLAT
jgi:asparagine synthase (glutamine-hydrolysing)